MEERVKDLLKGVFNATKKTIILREKMFAVAGKLDPFSSLVVPDLRGFPLFPLLDARPTGPPPTGTMTSTTSLASLLTAAVHAAPSLNCLHSLSSISPGPTTTSNQGRTNCGKSGHSVGPQLFLNCPRERGTGEPVKGPSSPAGKLET